MLYNLTVVLILFSTFTGWGILTSGVIGIRVARYYQRSILGVIAVTLISTLVGFFHPLNAPNEVFTITIGLIFLGIYCKKLTFSAWRNAKGVVTILILILFIGSFKPFIFDHYLYYINTIEWLRQYGLVKGISNLDLSMGQMSPWHILQATFSNIADKQLRINIVMILILVTYIVEEQRFVSLLFLPILCFFIQSPSPDLPVYIFSIIVANELLAGSGNMKLLLVFSVFAFTIKPTVLWLPICTAILALKQKLSRKYIIICISLFGLYIIKNLYCFGYPFFPLALDTFKMPWAPHPQILEESSHFGLQKTYDMQYSVDEINSWNLAEKIINWLNIGGIKSIMNYSLLLTAIVLAFKAVHKKNTLVNIVVYSLLVKIIIIFAVSGQYRFYLEVYFVTVIILLPSVKYLRNILIVSNLLLFITAFTFTFPAVLQKLVPSFTVGHYMVPFAMDQLLKPKSEKIYKYRSEKIGQFLFNTPDERDIRNLAPLPVIHSYDIYRYNKIGIFPKPYGSSLKHGFYWTRLQRHPEY